MTILPNASARGLVAQLAHTRVAGDNEDNTDNLVDLLTDLRHYAADNGVDFTRAVETSRRHFTAEVTR